MLTDEASQIQEVRYCLKTLREQMAARRINNIKKVKENPEDSAQLRELSQRLRAQMKETEKRHQEEKDRLQAESNEFRRRLDERSERLKLVEGKAVERGQKVEELERLLWGMEQEAASLRDKMAASKAELLKWRASKEEGAGKELRIEQLEKELAVLKQKTYGLDDMLKCQQRKFRHMIEQLQNSRTVIQERDRVIRDLEEKVAFLEAENTEIRDQMEYLLEGQTAPSTNKTENKPQIINSKTITPTSMDSNKSPPIIRVFEIMS